MKALFLTRVSRPVSEVPRWIVWLLFIGFISQITFHAYRLNVEPSATPLPHPPSVSAIKIFGMNENVLLSRLIMLWLQSFDNQPGISIPFKQLSYDRVQLWLDRAITLDEKSQYPLLAASRIYAEVSDPARQRQMLEFVYEQFLQDPQRRWPWLAHGVILAKHRLGDTPLALKYAHALADIPDTSHIPAWVLQMEIFILEDMNELDAVRVLTGGLLSSGKITDQHELQFLEKKLQKLSQVE
ncbi:MAG: hypothetical protein GXP10_05310 [Gammaproteobacteria bacterium]|nr:hypothetical protein [Gammaproteobacteria bacterium]